MLTIDAFLEYLSSELNRSQKTVENYREDLERFEKFAKSAVDDFSWETVDAELARSWMEDMLDKGNTPASVNRRLSALRSFYRFALIRKYVETDPVFRIKGPKRDRPLPQFLKESEMNELLDEKMWSSDYKDVRARTIIMLFYETGIRVSELVNLDISHVNLLNGEIKVTGKGNKQRIVPLGGELKNALGEYEKLRDSQVKVASVALFCSDKGKRISVDQVRRIVQKNLAKVCSLKKKSPHVLRHTFATAMLNHEAGMESVKKLLGHAKLSTTEIYTHTTFEQLKRVYNEAHPRA